MRNRITRGVNLGTLPIEDVDLSIKSRHQLPKILKSLQHIYTQHELRESILDIIQDCVHGKVGNKNTGRMGMGLWEIFVFAVVRLNLNIDYDNLQDYGNNHISMRGILGVSNITDFNLSVVYNLQTIKDNVGLLDADTITQINELVVKHGHTLIKKKKKNRYLD